MTHSQMLDCVRMPIMLAVLLAAMTVICGFCGI